MPIPSCTSKFYQAGLRSWLVAMALLVATTGGLMFPARAQADEPYEKFLQRLKDERLYDLALVYLDDLQAHARVNPEFRSNLQLERGLLLYQSAAVLPTSNPLREAKLDEAEQALRAFLQEQPQHPRRNEARLKIGELLLQRADEAATREDDPSVDNEQAVQFYGEAHQLFESTIAELASILKNIQGARTDPNNKTAVAYRQSIQQQYRQAQLLSAKSVEERGRNRAVGSKQRTQDLEQALNMFSDLYSKEQRMVAVRNYALFYRSSIHEALDDRSAAIDGFRRIADLDGIDALRPLQTDAITELIQLLAKDGKYALAIDRADDWVKNLRPDEVELPEALNLKLELAKLRVDWSRSLKKQDPEDRVANRLVRTARDNLRSLVRTSGPHLDEARQLLGELGVETTTEPTDELPAVKSFSEAFAEAQERIDQSENDALGLAVLREQGQTERAEEVQKAIDETRQQAISLLREALRLYAPADELTQLDSARFSSAYLALKQEKPWEALSIAEFLSRKNPRTDQGLRAAAIALAGLSDLLRTGSADEKVQLTSHLEPFAKYLVATWPDSGEASAAASALVQLALLNEQWDKVVDYLAMAPQEGETAVKLHRTAGLSFFSRYLQQKGQAETENAEELKKLAVRSLTIATSQLAPGTMDSESLEAVNALTRLLLAEGRSDEAASLLLDAETSPLKLLEKDPLLAEPKVAMNSYRTAIQLLISQLAESSIDSQQAISMTADYITRMQQLAEKTPSGSSLLAGIFVSLAKDLKQQLAESGNAEKQKRLSEAMLMLAREAGKAETFSTRFWAADSLLSIADEMAGVRSSRQLAMQAYGDSRDILQLILDQEKQQAGYIQPPGFSVQIRLMLARASRGLGDFKNAMNQLAEILEESNALLDVQMEAARTYQAWGDAINLGFHKAAYLGGRPDPKTRNNLIWGWGKVARVVEGKSEYQEEFYEARYQLARSRYKYGSSLNAPEQQQATYRRAAKDITATATLYPELGGPAMKKKYNSLLKQIQSSLGEQATGLSNPSPSAP